MTKEIQIKELATKEMVAAALVETPKKEIAQQLIYCGPSITEIGLQQFSVFKNGIPEHATLIGESCRAVVLLFKPISELATTREKINKKGSRDYQLYQNVLKHTGRES
ncbi:MAG TPA: hypothetical protein K8V56_20655 [Sporosarcina psychrophila]|uniref:Uncharacterized protein n=1 Tax=Sporosarcina psychrophila TaxID=1476 RepID=A0A921KEU3_SPOPS|nr:hypothetical protein [Sporosarcina psychrophila]